nr:MAG TPA: hypothetical protein [Caudoviricetes sp.]
MISKKSYVSRCVVSVAWSAIFFYGILKVLQF